MTKCTGKYLGKLKMISIHEESQYEINTDAPKDIGGEASSIAPTDLVGTALATCIITTMGLVAERDGKSLEGTTYSVIKEMSTDTPRRIAKLSLDITLPGHLDNDTRVKLEKAGGKCPVKQSLHPEVELVINYIYN
jgi:putative redox protein